MQTGIFFPDGLNECLEEGNNFVGDFAAEGHGHISDLLSDSFLVHHLLTRISNFK